MKTEINNHIELELEDGSRYVDISLQNDKAYVNKQEAIKIIEFLTSAFNLQK